MVIEVCFLLKALIGKYVLGPTKNIEHPVVDFESNSPAKSESLNNHNLQSIMLSPMNPLIDPSIEELM